MYLSTFNAYHLPPVKADSWQVDSTFQDTFTTADEVDGIEPTMGNAPFLTDEATLTVTFQITPSYMKNPGPLGASYALNQGGIDSALLDFSYNVFAQGKETLTALPTPGTTPDGSLYGLGGTITSWTAVVWPAKTYAIRRNPGGAMVAAEIDCTFVIPSGRWVVNFTGGGSTTIPVH